VGIIENLIVLVPVLIRIGQEVGITIILKENIQEGENNGRSIKK
jgi:hypothetical protein